MSSFISNIDKIAAQLKMTKAEFRDAYLYSVVTTRDLSKIELNLTSSRIDVVGSVQIQASRKCIGNLFAGRQLKIQRRAVDQYGAEELIPKLCTTLGIPVPVEDVRLSFAADKTHLYLQVQPYSPDWYGELMVTIQE